MDKQTRSRLVQEHLDAIARLHAQEAQEEAASTWPPRNYYLLFHVVIGMMLGFIGATTSLLFNVVGASLLGEPALKLIRVYLTFPMGAEALKLDSRPDEGVVLFVGCCLYLITGSIYGVIFHLVLSRFFADSSVALRWIVGTVMGLALWLINFYLVLSWLQPLLQGEAYILNNVPFWVAASTHLVFAWTVLLAEVWGRFEPGTMPTAPAGNNSTRATGQSGPGNGAAGAKA